VKIPAETPETGSTELETIGTVYHTARTKCDDSTLKAQRKQVKRRKKSREFKHGAPRDPNDGAYVSSHRQPVATRHTAPSAYSGVSSAPLSSSGPHPASHGNRSSSAQPLDNSGCYNRGNPTHRARETEQRPDEHGVRNTITIDKSQTFKLDAALLITEDPAVILVGESLLEYEGVEPRMWSTAGVADAAQRDGDRKGTTGPYIPSFSANERLEDGNRETEEAVWT